MIGGHVDHGKSTIIGRLLADTGSLPEGKLERVRALCAQTAKPFEYAFLLDALRDEQAQGITIDAARIFFRTARRQYLIIDAPGHVEFVKNLVTGASRAEAALLVIDAAEGVQENSRRHGYLMAMLGIGQIAVLVNKMDLVDYQKAAFEAIVAEYGAFLDRLGVRPVGFVPVCGRTGENVATPAAALGWYEGRTVLETLDGFGAPPAPTAQPFRMPVQDVYKFTRMGDDRRIVAGTVETGTLRAGDEVRFYPSGKRSRVRSLEAFHRPPATSVEAGQAVGFTLGEQIYVARGEIATRAGEPPPRVTTRLRASLFWLGKQPLVRKKDYVFKLGTARALARVEEIRRVIDAATLDTDEQKSRVDRHEVAECVLTLNKAVAFDVVEENAATGRFVLVDDFEIRGGGVVREALPDRQTWVRDKVLLRNSKWEASTVSVERRAERYGQRATLLLVTGEPDADRKGLAKELEARLFAEGKVVYFLGMGNVLYGVDADIERTAANRAEHLRRLAEVANILLDAGVILIVSAARLTQEDLDLVRTTVQPDRIETVWIGDHVTTDLDCDLHLPGAEAPDEAVQRIKGLLRDKGIIYHAW
ncbi:MAG TPA: GTP-binding protein [Methylomirabilota bacterium]|nr:GTP-binding protein [Methylomirabilota bacterium]